MLVLSMFRVYRVSDIWAQYAGDDAVLQHIPRLLHGVSGTCCMYMLYMYIHVCTCCMLCYAQYFLCVFAKQTVQ